MNTIQERTKLFNNDVEKVLLTTISQHSYYLINHNEAVRSHIEAGIDLFGMNATIELLDNIDSQFVKNIYEEIEISKENK